MIKNTDDNIDPQRSPPIPNVPEFSVSEISALLKQTVEQNFSFVRIRGEISGLSRPRSGHIYFAIKDERSLMDAVIWRGSVSRLHHEPEDGLEVIISGRLTIYPGRSKYQIVVEQLEPAGEGALLKQLEERRKRLAAEGLFDAERKKPLPYLPQIIGVITSPTGAVIKDILHRLRDRFPCHVILWPVKVQGEGAADEIARAIEGFNSLPSLDSTQQQIDESSRNIALRPDLIIVARGGGSLEDLWSFNEEIVVRAAAQSQIPLISAVGHETDTTLIDFASSQRAPTPTAAGEMAVPKRIDLLANCAGLSQALTNITYRIFEQKMERAQGLSRALPKPRHIFETMQQKHDEISIRLEHSLKHYHDHKSERVKGLSARLTAPHSQMRLLNTRQKALAHQMQQAINQLLPMEKYRSLARVLNNLSHTNVMKRGFALVWDGKAEKTNLLTSANETSKTRNVIIEFSDGQIEAHTTPPASTKAIGPKNIQEQKLKEKKNTDAISESPKQGSLL